VISWLLARPVEYLLRLVGVITGTYLQ
jgi:hypothetical protein